MKPTNIALHTLPYRACVGLMIINQSGKIFAGRRIDCKSNQAWQMPQGGIDEGETPEQAALRELEEETGITSNMVEVLDQTEDWLIYDLPPHLVPKLWSGRYRGQKQLWFALKFKGTDSDINIQTPAPEFSEWQWMRDDAIIPLIVPFKHDIYSEVFTKFRQFIQP